MIKVETVIDTKEVLEFLGRHKASSQFLIQNLSYKGPNLGNDPYSGNFKVIKNNEIIEAVFYIAKCGNIYAQAKDDQHTDLILTECLKEEISVKGFVGQWDILNPIYRSYVYKNPKFVPNNESKEVLYQLCLNRFVVKNLKNNAIRFLESSDFENWKLLRSAYFEELNLKSELSEKQLQARFELSVSRNLWWGYFYDEKLVSIAGLNSSVKDIGQVGGVYTVKSYRKKSFSKSTMLQLVADCKELHKHTTSVLFTGENNTAARKLYESIGYEKIGYFMLVLS